MTRVCTGEVRTTQARDNLVRLEVGNASELKIAECSWFLLLGGGGGGGGGGGCRIPSHSGSVIDERFSKMNILIMQGHGRY